MGLLPGRHDEPHQKFRMREKMIAVGDDYWIENDAGDKVFKVNGKALRIRETWKLEDGRGRRSPRSRRSGSGCATPMASR